ncbi:hypothetical protein B0H14DRAFT_3169398 [Mycena olivaceomarginata]|nr:hypothetical protein B0H14DRAFT_3169398 [Mycena olivaceomarginata]
MTPKVPKRSWYATGSVLRLSAFLLHLALIVMHLILAVIWASKLEHRVTVSLDNQKLVSFLITSTATAFGTIYSGLLVFVTQTLSMRRSLQMDQSTARKSITGAAPVALYLASILGLHIAISSLFSLVTYNPTQSFNAGVQGLPALKQIPQGDEFGDVAAYVRGSLQLLPFVLSNATNVGLQDGTVIDTLETFSSVPGEATMNAVGFDVTCGFVAPKELQFSEQQQAWILDDDPGFQEAGAIHVPAAWIYPTRELIALDIELLHRESYRTRDNLYGVNFKRQHDSAGKQSPLFALKPPMSTGISSIQVLRCSLALVDQLAVVDAQTQQIKKIQPSFKKATSNWQPHREPSQIAYDSEDLPASFPNVTAENLLINAIQCLKSVNYVQWEKWYNLIPASDFMLDYMNQNGTATSAADVYLIQTLNLPPANLNNTRSVTLHDVENTLSTIVASVFWTGNATVTGIFTRARLEVSAGFGISIILMTLALSLLRLPGGYKRDEDFPIDGSSILHAIWLYRNHPHLETLLEQVEHPTDLNLRAAGMGCAPCPSRARPSFRRGSKTSTERDGRRDGRHGPPVGAGWCLALIYWFLFSGEPQTNNFRRILWIDLKVLNAYMHKRKLPFWLLAPGTSVVPSRPSTPQTVPLPSRQQIFIGPDGTGRLPVAGVPSNRRDGHGAQPYAC